MAPYNEQPDFPFVYVDWNVDCELSEEDNNEEDEKNTITKNITWDRDRCDYMDYYREMFHPGRVRSAMHMI